MGNKVMGSNWTSLMSAFGIPVLGLSGLLFSLWHANAGGAPASASQALVYLQEPNSHFDKSLTIYLTQQAKNVAQCRASARRADIAQSVAEYNLIARECTPAVFDATHLPLSQEP